jgi:hypothetical protein
MAAHIFASGAPSPLEAREFGRGKTDDFTLALPAIL